MAQSEVHPATTITETNTGTQEISAHGERKLRRVIAWLLLFFLTQGELGAVWDREWHAYVGRDQFWTPPHTLIYSCVAGAGLIALTFVFIETYRYYHHIPGVDGTSTISIFKIFHAPLGFIVLGFGALIALIAAPLDNYWHELYGIDIALWAPFHMMGVTGGLIGMLGMVYIFAAEAAIDQQANKKSRRFLGLSALETGTLLTMASIMNFVLTGFLQFPLVTLGPLQISTYPLPIIASAGLIFLSAVRVTNKPGAATLVNLVLVLHTLLVEIFVPWAVRTAATQQGLAFRTPEQVPHFSLAYAFLPIIFIISALVVDIFAAIQKRRSGWTSSTTVKAIIQGVIIAPPIFLIAPFVLQSYSVYAPVFLPETGLPVSAGLMTFAVIFSVLAALAMGALGGFLGAEFGDIWHWNVR